MIDLFAPLSDPRTPTTPAQSSGPVVSVLLPLALDEPFSYRAPDQQPLPAGTVVAVPLGSRETIGVVWDSTESNKETGQKAANPPATGSLKTILHRVDAPPLSTALRHFIDWVARYTLAPKGMVMRMALNKPEAERTERPRLAVRLSGPAPHRLTPARQKVLTLASSGLTYTKQALAEEAGVSHSVIDGLIDEGTLETLVLAADPVALPPDPHHHIPVLSADQHKVADALKNSVAARAFSVTLLEGVTGSGKTEVYFEAVAAALAQGQQVLILVPEIALTTQFLDRFASRFGVRPAQWHSSLTGRKRERIYAALASGEAQVVAGARSALFLPFQSLGLIIVDEEHEGAYKQEDGVHYHARDMAVVRGKIEQATVILASATPSLESRINAANGRYAHVLLPHRYGGSSLPQIEAIDMRTHQAGKGLWLSPPLIAALQETIERGEQSLLYLNRRGYAPLTLCRSCGHRVQCPNCSAWLVEHRHRRALMCHHCGHLERMPERCPSCEAADKLAPCGPGVERLAEEVAALFPDQRCLVLSSDMPGGLERLQREFDAIAKGQCDIMIGTQLVTKGHHFPLLSLVGVVDGDLGLASGDPRAAERSFQVLQQVAGRAGREKTKGRALIQTYQPDHPVIRALLSGDAEQFYQAEQSMRQHAGLPPFGRLAALIIASPDRQQAEQVAQHLARIAAPPADVVVLGPAEAPIAKLRTRYRFRLLVKSSRHVDLQSFIRAWLARLPKQKGELRITVDIDPYSFY